MIRSLDTRRAPFWLFLACLSAVAGLAELAFVIVNISSLPRFLSTGLGMPALPGIAMATFYLAEAVGNSPMGALADRLGRRRLMVSGCLLSVLTCLGTAQLRLPTGGPALGGMIAVLLLMRALDGLGAAMLWPSVFASVGDRCDKDKQARAMTILNATYLVGLAIGPLLGGFANETFGRRFSETDPHRYAPSFYLAAGCFVLAAVLAYVVAPSRRQSVTPSSEAAASVAGGAAPADAAVAIEHAPPSVGALKNAIRRVPWLMLLGFLIFMSVGLIGPYVKNYFMDRFGLSESGFGTALLGPALLIGAVSVPLGHLADKWGKTRAIRLGMFLCVVALWGIQFASNKALVVVLGSLQGIGFVLAFPSYMAYLANIADDNERGGLIGAVRLAQGVGALTGAGLASVLHLVHASNAIIFGTASSLLTVGFVMSLIVVREGKGEREKGKG